MSRMRFGRPLILVKRQHETSDLQPSNAYRQGFGPGLCCGTGLVALGAAEAVGANGGVVGVDLSQGMLDQVGWKL